MASIDRRQDGHYRARWREYPGGPQKTKQFRRKKDAELFLDVIRGDLAHGRYVDPTGGRTRCMEYAVQRRLGHRSAMETLDTYGHLWPDSDDETRAVVDHVLAGVGRAG